MIRIGQNLFHDESYRIQIEYRTKSCYVMFDGDEVDENDIEEEELDNKKTFIRLFIQFGSFLDLCLYKNNNVRTNFLKRLLLKYITWRCKRSMNSNIFLDITLLKELYKQPVLDNFLIYKQLPTNMVSFL